MSIDLINKNGLLLLGCGKMGSALLKGWLADGVCPEAINIVEPNPSKWLLNLPEISLNKNLPDKAAVVVLAVKPQMMKVALNKILSLQVLRQFFYPLQQVQQLKCLKKNWGKVL